MSANGLTLSILDQSPVHQNDTAAQAFQHTIELASKADGWVYHRYWVAEHHNTKSFAGSAPEVLISRLAAEVVSAERVPEAEAAGGAIFDGFPRTVAQAEALDAALAKRGSKVDAVVRLLVDDKELVARMEKRAAEEGRADDNIDAFKVRLKNYQDQTAPLIPFYAQSGKMREVPGMGSMDEVAAGIAAALEEK